MPKKVGNIKKVRKIETPMSPENKKLYDNRMFRFTEILGSDLSKKEIQKIVESKIDYWDLQNLIDNGCSSELAIKILL